MSIRYLSYFLQLLAIILITFVDSIFAQSLPTYPLPQFGTVTVSPDFQVNGAGQNIDTIEFWKAPDSTETLMFVTAKDNNVVEVWQYPFEGNELPPLTHSTFSGGQVNGLAIDQEADLLYVSIGNTSNTVSVFSLPDLTFQFSFIESGVNLQTEPNLAILNLTNGNKNIYVSADFPVYIHDAEDGNYINEFTPTKGLETMASDSFYQRLYIPDENGRTGVYVYNPDGTAYTDNGSNVFGTTQFSADAEGIIVYNYPLNDPVDMGNGFIVVADQRFQTDFEFFDRITWDHLGKLHISGVSNTDGIASYPYPLPDYPLGVFAAVDNDQSVAIVGWDKIFAEILPTITVTLPNGGESWSAGSQQFIAWNDNIAENVKIELYKSGTFNSTITSSTSSDGSYTWAIPAGATPASDYTIKITSINDGNITDISDTEFTITAPQPIQTKFAVIGDYGDDNQDEQAVADLINTWNVDLIITTGDNSYDATPIDQNVGKYYSDYIGNYNGSYGTGSPVNKFFPSLGNHDYSDGGGITAYLNYFTLPGISGNTSGNERYYDYVIDNIHFFAINSVGSEPDGNDGASIQANWLQTQMTNSTANWQIVYFHHSPYSSGQHGSSDIMKWDFAQWGADAVMSGHDHTYERLEADGLTYFVNGLGGRSIYNFGSPLPETQFRYNGDFGAMLVEATESTLTAKFYNTNGDLIDTWTKDNTVISITEPNGGEIWQTGSLYQIKWNDAISENVKIELYKGGAIHSQITSSTSSDGSYNWTIPASTAQGVDYRIKITSVDDDNITGSSDLDFSIIDVSFVTVSSPNGGESWQAGTQQTITWDDNIIEDVKIDLYKGAVFNSNINNTALDFPVDLYNSPESEKTIFVNLTRPIDIPANVIYKITAFDADHGREDPPEGEFYINGNGPLDLFPGATQANGNDVINDFTFNIPSSWLVDGANELRFVRLYSTGFQIEAATLLVDGVASYGNNAYSWNIPTGITPASDYTVKITNISDPNLSDLSNTDFSITTTPFITVTTPNGGESWQAGTQQTITWNDNITENVKIELYKNGTPNSTIIASTTSNGSYSWDIPSGTIPASDYTIKITSINDGNITDVSDAVFDITAASFITVTAPDGGENWQAGTQQTITWNDNISENVKIELYKNASLNSTIVASTTSNGSYSWDIPSGTTPASDYTVKITSVTDPGLSDISNAVFDITAASFITVTAPDGGESWEAGTQQTITWNDNITVNVKIELYKNGTPNSTIIASTSSNGSYDWDIPSGTTPASDYTIKITSINDGNISDVSDAVFNITAASFITVTAPDGGEIWQAGTQQTITWNDNISENVKIELFKGGTPNSTIVTSTTSDGSYSWDIPSGTTPASDYTIKITM
jgi:hypothetical protein